ncbi:MAG: acetyl-CoA carboxylase biotin carboxylase subunit [Deferribacterota bacterium]|nr:acetyl-CoA carboxylase biotin carboxylase subunit [Deferribacterota bacterium]
MFNKILIANRGEIALRIIRACKELGIATVAVHSQVDNESLHVAFADEAICIGPYSASESYLNIKNIISAAEVAGADAIHPGYGFLAENANFARICNECNIRFIGPKVEHIDTMGNKSKAKEVMEKLGVPVVPGSKSAVRNLEEGLAVANDTGYPVMIKASAGGGGKGMRVVYDKDGFTKAFNMSKYEAKKSFGDDSVYIEKYIENPRHIEVQIFGDNYGNVVHFFERECSIQRRHQKVLEEAPSPFVDDKLRESMGEASVKAMKSLGYQNCGTIEYLVDKNKNFYFMEMNTRIQVEHPVTEMITSVDLLKLQIMAAAGERLPYNQEDLKINGHAIEVRINAEDPKTFRPSPGKITGYYAPGGFGVRVDSTCYQDYIVLPYYDSLIAKLITFDNTRRDAISKMKRSLDEFIIEGIDTTIPLHKRIIVDKNFCDGNFSTSYLDQLV